MTKGYSFIQLGLSGNRLLRQLEAVDLYARNYTNITIDKQCFGIAGIERFQREALECHQIKQIMIAIGINDLYQPGTFCAQISELHEIEERKGISIIKKYDFRYSSIMVWHNTIYRKFRLDIIKRKDPFTNK